MRRLVIWGCGGHAREVVHLCSFLDVQVLGYLDERRDWKGRLVDDLPVLGDLGDIHDLRKHVELVCAGVGDPALKLKFWRRTMEAGFHLAKPLVHPGVHLSRRVMVADGTIICEGTIITTNVQIGKCVILNRLSNISHDCTIEDFVTVSPGANISGNVTIREGAYIGTGSSIREKMTIGEWSVVGGGAFVANDVDAETMVVGVPAKFCKNILKGDIWLSATQ